MPVFGWLIYLISYNANYSSTKLALDVADEIFDDAQAFFKNFLNMAIYTSGFSSTTLCEAPSITSN